MGRKAQAYEVVVRMMKEPTRSVKAAVLPRGMAPKAVVMRPVKMVAGIGQLRVSLTLLKSFGNGVAPSRALEGGVLVEFM